MYALEEEPEILGVNSWCDTMTQVRDPRLCLFTAFKTLTRPLNLSFNRFLPAVQYVRIQVTLKRDTWADGLPSDGWFNTPVQPDHVVATGLSDIFQRTVRSFGEKGERNNWKPLGVQSLANFSGDVLEGRG